MSGASTSPSPPWRPSAWLIVGVATLVGLLLTAALYPQAFADGFELLRQGIMRWLEGVHPAAFLLAFAILPVFGFPLTFFYLTVGGVTGSLWYALPTAWLAVLTNMALTYLGARTFLRAPLQRWVARRGKHVPQISQADEWKAIVLMRASPTPWLLQSILLTLAGTRFIPYLAWSLPIQGTIGATLIIAGESVLAGDLGWALGGFFGFLVISLGASAVWKRHRRGTESSQVPSAH
ncbi:MAG: hypothetical protein ACOC3I_10615 [Verrucomicrobiota bacterium]